mgnify:CR=1 FL=1
MIYEGTEQVTSLMIGSMGVKTVAVGNDVVYERPGGYIYIQVISDDEEGEN